MEKSYHWTMQGFVEAFPPPDAQEQIDKVNNILDEYVRDTGDEEGAKELSRTFWENYCRLRRE